MKKIKVFYREESPYYPGKYRIAMNLGDFYCNYTEGSYNVVQARLFCLSYPQFLRMCRDCFGAEIIGKGSKYPIAYFKQSEGLKALIDELNARANMVLWEREHPNFEEHKEYVKNNAPRAYKRITGGE